MSCPKRSLCQLSRGAVLCAFPLMYSSQWGLFAQCLSCPLCWVSRGHGPYLSCPQMSGPPAEQLLSEAKSPLLSSWSIWRVTKGPEVMSAPVRVWSRGPKKKSGRRSLIPASKKGLYLYLYLWHKSSRVLQINTQFEVPSQSQTEPWYWEFNRRTNVDYPRAH